MIKARARRTGPVLMASWSGADATSTSVGFDDVELDVGLAGVGRLGVQVIRADDCTGGGHRVLPTAGCAVNVLLLPDEGKRRRTSTRCSRATDQRSILDGGCRGSAPVRMPFEGFRATWRWHGRNIGRLFDGARTSSLPLGRFVLHIKPPTLTCICKSCGWPEYTSSRIKVVQGHGGSTFRDRERKIAGSRGDRYEEYRTRWSMPCKGTQAWSSLGRAVHRQEIEKRPAPARRKIGRSWPMCEALVGRGFDSVRHGGRVPASGLRQPQKAARIVPGQASRSTPTTVRSPQQAGRRHATWARRTRWTALAGCPRRSNHRNGASADNVRRHSPRSSKAPTFHPGTSD